MFPVYLKDTAEATVPLLVCFQVLHFMFSSHFLYEAHINTKGYSDFHVLRKMYQ